MGKRSVRVNELVKREVSTILHKNYQEESVCITIVDVEISPDLRSGRIFYSVIGDAEKIAKAARLFGKVGAEINRLLGKNVTLKYTPKLRFVYDDSIKQGMHTIDIMDSLEEDNSN
jgi:ribosome-binding factor A